MWSWEYLNNYTNTIWGPPLLVWHLYHTNNKSATVLPKCHRCCINTTQEVGTILAVVQHMCHLRSWHGSCIGATAVPLWSTNALRCVVVQSGPKWSEVVRSGPEKWECKSVWSTLWTTTAPQQKHHNNSTTAALYIRQQQQHHIEPINKTQQQQHNSSTTNNKRIQ